MVKPVLEPSEVVAVFKRRRIRQLYLLIPVLVVVFAVLMFRNTHTQQVLGVSTDIVYLICAFLIAMIGIITLLNWRCPFCKAYIGEQFNPRYCSKCGTNLR